ncbi:MAG: peptide ABC transporter substrate-binding protein [Reinekea sp.]
MKPFQTTLAAALVSSAVFMVGCSSDEDAKSAENKAADTQTAEVKAGSTHPVTGETLAADQTFRYWEIDEPDSFDPQLMEGVHSSYHARNLFEGLLNQDADGNLVPGVAERYEASEDKKTYTFYLRKDAKWTNGDPVTANDFVFAWKRAVNPETASPYSWFMELMNIKNATAIINAEADVDTLGVKAVDDYTFQVKLEGSLPYFANMVTHSTTFPTPKAVIEQYGSDWTKPEHIVSNGAYKLVTHVVNERSELVRNELYWDNEHTIINKIETFVIPDENQALIRWKADEYDWMESIPAGQFKSLQKEFPNQVLVAPRLCSYYYQINQRDNSLPALLDVRVRKALSYSIDRNIIVDNITQGGQYPAYTFTPGATAGFEVPKVAYAKLTQAERDAEAKKLMEEAGYGDGLKLEILYNTSESHKAIAIAISQMWKTKLGIETTLKNIEWKTFLTDKKDGNFEISRSGWCGDYNEASTFLDLVRSTNVQNEGHYINPEVDKLLDEAKTMDDPNPNYTKIEQIMADDMAIIPLYHYTVNYMMKDNVKGWPINNVEQNWYAKDLYKVAK